MCPGLEHDQIFPASFSHNFDLAAGEIAHPSGKPQVSGLIVGRKSKADAMHPPADYQVQSRPRGIHCGARPYRVGGTTRSPVR